MNVSDRLLARLGAIALALAIAGPMPQGLGGAIAGGAGSHAATISAGSRAAVARPLPPIVFVRRNALSEPGAIPGFGPHHRADAPGGTLLLRGADGSVRDVLRRATPVYDVSDPSVSPDGRTVAFAACAERGGRWRIWTCDLA